VDILHSSETAQYAFGSVADEREITEQANGAAWDALASQGTASDDMLRRREYLRKGQVSVALDLFSFDAVTVHQVGNDPVRRKP
jgi:hypothetical protein